MTNTEQRSFLKRHIFALTIILILCTSMIIPGIVHLAPKEGPMVQPDPIPDPINWVAPIVSTVAGEPNFTRESYPFILNNYPDFYWKNPGQFDGAKDGSDNKVYDPDGYDSSERAAGAGAPAYPEIYAALEGLNESNIRICYMDATYEWTSVPYQIDNKGWVNIWSPADLNKWGGIDTSVAVGNGGSDHTAADPTIGMGWLAGDMVISAPANLQSSEGASYSGNDLLWDWYRFPQWTYITPGVTEELHIDPEYRDDLVWTFNADTGNRPHVGWLTGGDDNNPTNPWNEGPADGSVPRYPKWSTNGYNPAFVE